MTCREEEEPLGSFEDAIAAEGARLAPELARVERDQRYNSWPLGCWSYLLRSRYVEQLERWFGLLSREQFHFVDNEQLATRPEEAMAAVDDFLGLPPHQGRSFASRHVASYDALDPTTRAELVEYFRPYNERLYRLIGINFGWEQPLTATASR
jgi:hypothetical protein